MKKAILFAVIFGFFLMTVPKTPLFADISVGGRVDAGLGLFILPASASDVSSDENVSVLPIIPLIDAGFYAQYTFGVLNLGIGLRAFSLIAISVFSPSIHAELNLWRFTLNAQITGGALYVFPLYLIAGPYFAPELSLWYTLNSGKNQMRIGFGAITLISPWNVNLEYIRDFSNNVVFYIAGKIVFPNTWKSW